MFRYIRYAGHVFVSNLTIETNIIFVIIYFFVHAWTFKNYICKFYRYIANYNLTWTILKQFWNLFQNLIITLLVIVIYFFLDSHFSNRYVHTYTRARAHARTHACTQDCTMENIEEKREKHCKDIMLKKTERKKKKRKKEKEKGKEKWIISIRFKNIIYKEIEIARNISIFFLIKYCAI